MFDDHPYKWGLWWLFFLVLMFLQGDVEKNLGWKPIPLFDRDHAAEVASMQVKMFSVEQIQM